MVRSRGGRTRSVRARGAGGWLLQGLAGTVLVCAVANAPAAAEDAGWRALVVGVEAYPGLPGKDGPAKGSDAGARDLAAVLRGRGVADVSLLIDGEVAREPLLRDMDSLVARTRAGDVVLLAFDGLGISAAAAPAEGLATVLLLPGGSPAHPDAGHVLNGSDLARFVERVEERGGRAVLVVDASFGAVAARDHAGGQASAMPVGLVTDPGASPFARSLVLAASDPRFGSAAIAIPGVVGPRRALTYAVARAFEGRADFDHDGAVSVPELVAYTARLVYQLSDQRQKVAVLWPRDSLPASVATRGIVIRATTVPGELLPPPATARADPPLLRASGGGGGAGFKTPAGPPVRLAASTGTAQQLAGVAPREGTVEPVARTDDPDLIWDPGGHDVITPDGDLIAENVAVTDLDGVVDRTAALRQLKAMVIDAPQQIAVLPNDEVQRRGSLVKVEIGNASGRYLVLFNIRSDGTVQPLYPLANDPPVVTTPTYTLPLSVNVPLGADQIVAVTGSQRMTDLEKGLADLSGQKAPGAAIRLIRDHAAAGALVGSVGVFSGTP